MLSLNDRLIREAQNEKICRQIFAAYRQEEELKTREPKAKYDYPRTGFSGNRAVLRLGFVVIALVLALLLTAEVVMASDAYGGVVMGYDVMGGEVMGRAVMGGEVMGYDAMGAEAYGADAYGGEVMGGDVMGGEVMGGDAAPETGKSSNWLSWLKFALGMGSVGSAPQGVNYY